MWPVGGPASPLVPFGNQLGSSQYQLGRLTRVSEASGFVVIWCGDENLKTTRELQCTPAIRPGTAATAIIFRMICSAQLYSEGRNLSKSREAPTASGDVGTGTVNFKDRVRPERAWLAV